MRPQRVAGFSYVGFHRYFLTFCTDRRRAVFISQEAVSPVLTQFRQLATIYAFENLAYCFMPDHLHLVCEGLTLSSDLLTFVHQAKQRTGYAAKQATGYRLWQEGFYEHILRDDESLLAVIRYVVTNPVRDGLTKDIGEYPFCGSDRYTMDEIRACGEMWEPRRSTTAMRRP